MLLDYENVTVYRGDQVALDRIAFSVESGQHVAILGPNGSGKSTLIKTMTRECYPYRGHGPVRLRIMERETWSVFDLRAMLGIVTNDLIAACTRHLTARDVVVSGFFSSIGLWPHHEVTADDGAAAAAILERLEVPHLADRYLDELSSGEARRIVIARALVHDPKALVLDEPTNSLDVRSTYELREIVRRIARDGHDRHPRHPSSRRHHPGDRPRDSPEGRPDREGRARSRRCSRRPRSRISTACRSKCRSAAAITSGGEPWEVRSQK